MAAYDDIVSRLDFQQLAQQVGAEPHEVEQAVHSILPALVGVACRPTPPIPAGRTRCSTR